MSNYLTTDTDLTAVANAIRSKGGTSAQLAFPSGFVTAIGNIPSGGGGVQNGTFTPTERIFEISLTLSNSTPISIIMIMAQSSPYLGNGRTIFGFVYEDQVFDVLINSNAAGTNSTVSLDANRISVSQSGNALTLTGNVSAGAFESGITYSWFAW